MVLATRFLTEHLHRLCREGKPLPMINDQWLLKLFQMVSRATKNTDPTQDDLELTETLHYLIANSMEFATLVNLDQLPIRVQRFTNYFAQTYATNLNNHCFGNVELYMKKFVKMQLLSFNEQLIESKRLSKKMIGKATKAIMDGIISDSSYQHPTGASTVLLNHMEIISGQLTGMLEIVGAQWLGNSKQRKLHFPEQRQIIHLYWLLLSFELEGFDIVLVPLFNFKAKHITIDRSFLDQLRTHVNKNLKQSSKLPKAVKFTHFFKIKKYLRRFARPKRNRKALELSYLQTDGVSASLVFSDPNRKKKGRPKKEDQKVEKVALISLFFFNLTFSCRINKF
jgi:hypothetical protein